MAGAPRSSSVTVMVERRSVVTITSRIVCLKRAEPQLPSIRDTEAVYAARDMQQTSASCDVDTLHNLHLEIIGSSGGSGSGSGSGSVCEHVRFG